MWSILGFRVDDYGVDSDVIQIYMAYCNDQITQWLCGRFSVIKVYMACCNGQGTHLSLTEAYKIWQCNLG